MARYTKWVIEQDKIPYPTRDKLNDLDHQLHVFRDSLPDQLQLNSRNMFFMAYSRDATGYFMLRSQWEQCRCDLYRFLIPGIRESISEATIASTPADFVTECQVRCLEGAIARCNIWAESHRIGLHLRNCHLVVFVYQCAMIIHRLSHLLPSIETLPSMKDKLSLALEMARKIKHGRFRVKKWVSLREG